MTSSDPSAPTATSSWSDLRIRFVSGVALAIVGIGIVALGGLPLTLIVSLVCGIIIWELARICGAGEPELLGMSAGVSALFVLLLPVGYGLPFLMLPAFIGIARLAEHKVPFAVFAVLILLASFGLVHIRDLFGPWWMAWLILVVVGTDIAGYFAGRALGGPKLWPRVSPKKTWSGTIAGWLTAVVIGIGAMIWLDATPNVIGLSIALSMASQLGDIAESALKRRTGCKDSSALLPGHGGVFDRFDGLLGATVLLLMVARVVDFPPVSMGG